MDYMGVIISGSAGLILGMIWLVMALVLEEENWAIAGLIIAFIGAVIVFPIGLSLRDSALVQRENTTYHKIFLEVLSIEHKADGDIIVIQDKEGQMRLLKRVSEDYFELINVKKYR